MRPDGRPIAMLDSGVGGLSILREVRSQLPNEDVLYFADQAHVPYGPRSKEEIHHFTAGITRFFLTFDAKVIVIACNTASAVSLHPLRAAFPQVPFVGMEPAVKPAAERTRSGVIGVMMTQTTYQGDLFASVVDRFADGVEVVPQVCPDFVALVEAGQLDTPAVWEAAQGYLRPLLDTGVDQLVLGCTHFPFLVPVLREIAGPQVEIVDPGPAIARQTGRVVAAQRNVPEHEGRVTYYTSGAPEVFHALASRLVDEPIGREQIISVEWRDEGLYQIS